MAHTYDVIIIGMGSGGMIAAEFAAKIGVTPVVVERSRVGGDCLWTGCVPSKALLASAKVAHHMRTADRYGLPSVAPTIDTGLVWDRIKKIQQEIASGADSPERYTDELGIEIVFGAARITGPNTVTVDDRELAARFILVCTGSRPAVPPIPGLADAGFITSESIFELERPPESAVFIGGGPIAVEMAQAFNRLGVRSTLLQKGDRLCPRDEPVLVDMLTEVLRAEGVDIHTNVETARVTIGEGMKTVHGTAGGAERGWTAHDLVVAAGRIPNIDGLGLDEAGVKTTPRGIEVDGRLRTNVSTIYAAGDVAGRYLFTHSAGYEAVQALRDMFFPGRGKAPNQVPWCTFTDPELAHVGMTIAEAEETHGDDVEVWRQDLAHSDRAIADGATEGGVIVVTAKKKIVGAHILGPAAGELIHELALAVREGIKLTDLAGMVHVYPTLSTSIGQVAQEAAYVRAEKLRWLVKKR